MNAKEIIEILQNVMGSIVLPVLLIGGLAYGAYILGWLRNEQHRTQNPVVIQVTDYVLENGKIARFDPRLPGIFLMLDPKGNEIERWRYGTQAGFLESISTTKALKLLKEARSEKKTMENKPAEAK